MDHLNFSLFGGGDLELIALGCWYHMDHLLGLELMALGSLLHGEDVGIYVALLWKSSHLIRRQSPANFPLCSLLRTMHSGKV